MNIAISGQPILSKLKIITSSARFDGHDVSINIFRRLLLRRGLEVVHMGHDRPVDELVRAVVEEDAAGLLVSSYQGGHNEFFRYLVDSLNRIKPAVKLFGGGGGVISPDEIHLLEQYGVEKIYHAADGGRLGLDGIVSDIIKRLSVDRDEPEPTEKGDARVLLGEALTVVEQQALTHDSRHDSTYNSRHGAGGNCMVIGITGPGGCGKSSLTDELVNRFLKLTSLKIAILSVDPTKKSTGGALLGDRIRMNSIYNDRVFMRSVATRSSMSEIGGSIEGMIAVLEQEYDVVFVETSGTGQADSAVYDISGISVYVMTSEFGAPSQLEKIEMLDLADFIAVNKSDKPGSEDTVREVRTVLGRNRGMSGLKSAGNILLPVFATNASGFNDPGVNRLCMAMLESGMFGDEKLKIDKMPALSLKGEAVSTGISSGYLAAVAGCVREYHRKAREQQQVAGDCDAVRCSLKLLRDAGGQTGELEGISAELTAQMDEGLARFLNGWKGGADVQVEQGEEDQNAEDMVDGGKNRSITGLDISKVALPRYGSWRELAWYYFLENRPGNFPYTAGIFPFRRIDEEPRRLFAGQADAASTNKRLHYLTGDDEFKRLSIAFDGVTLYGENPDNGPDIYGKVGESGVSIATIDEMERLFEGFDLADRQTSVSMTINGPAIILLAFYFKVAVRQQERKFSRSLNEHESRAVFAGLRGTVQADILKEDQGQNSCIFSIDFSLRLICDIQKYFAANNIRRYYTLSISGYHMAEAGANPITQLAFTLANGFYYLERFLGIGLDIDDFVENLSFFFSIGMEAEYAVIGRVARRIWAITLRDRYAAGSRGQRMKYHVQTSGRSLHAQEIGFNDIRTTLQALMAHYDNCNSLHTNSADEAVTTPTEQSVRRAVAIQMIIAREYGPGMNENPNQGSFIIEELTELVEEAVLLEFERLSSRGGVRGAMERQYQRSKIQEESAYYEEKKADGSLPVIGVNTFRADIDPEKVYDNMEMVRATKEEKDGIVERVEQFKMKHKPESGDALEALRRVILSGGNVFEELLNSVEHLSLGEITHLFYETGGKYRRNM